MEVNGSDLEFLRWLQDRLTSVYGENPNTDFVLRFKKIIDNVEKQESEKYDPSRHWDVWTDLANELKKHRP